MNFLKRISIPKRKRYSIPAEIWTKRNRVTWKELLHVTWDPVWYSLIIVIDYFCIISYSYNSVNGNCYKSKLTIGNTKMATFIFCTLALPFVLEFWYAFDVVCFVDVVLILITKYVPNMELTKANSEKRPLTILITELISTLPIEIFCPRDNFNIRLFCFLRLNRCLKIVRILHVLYLNLYRVHNKFLVRMVEMYMCFSFIIMITYIVYCNAECLIPGCAEEQHCSTYRVIVMIVNKVGKSGYDVFPEDSSLWEFISGITELLAVWAIFNFTLGHLVLRLFSLNYNQTVFVTRCNNTVNKFIGCTSHTLADIMNVYNIFWQQCRGYAIDKEELRAITPAMRKSLLFDISWMAFQHSQLLRALDLSVLRHIAERMTKKFLLPGDFIFRKNELKDKMVYVVSGSIQLLSQIDGESPVFRLCSGTCLGEASLVISYPSANNACCETFCEVLILEKSDFWQGLCKYPVQKDVFQKRMRERFLKAQETNKLAKVVKKNVYGDNLDTSMGNLFWIKHILHELMSVDPEARARHKNQNVYLEYEVDRNELNHLVFCADYLDLLAIGERVVADKDSLFVRSSFPCILQPNSILVYIWEVILIVFTACSFYLIPQMAFVIEQQPIWYSPFILGLTIIFWLDIWIQLSTSIKSRTKTVSKFSDILRERTGDLVFWTDLISCVPFEILSPVMLSEITSQINARMHLNRLFKIFRIEKLFRLWGQQFNANVVLCVFIKFLLINTFLAYVFYCNYFPLNKHMSNFSKWFGAIQTVTRIGISDESFQILPIYCAFTDLLFTGVDMYFHASIVAAYLLTQILRLETQYLCSDVIFTMKGSKWFLRNKQRIHTFLNSHWINNKCCDIMFTDSQLLDVSKTLYNELLYDAVGETIRSSIFFQDCPDEMIYGVCNDARMRLYPPEEVIIYAGDITHEIYFLKLGECMSLGDDGFSESRLRFADSINLLEACYDRPSCKTCITRSHCIMVVVDYRKLLRTMRRYQEEYRILRDVISDSPDIKSNLRENDNDLDWDLEPLKPKSIYFFNFNLPPGSQEEYDYYVPFDKLYPFNFICYLLLRFTILPEGKAYYVWECLRCMFAVISALVFFIPPLYYMNLWPILSYTLDATAYIDIYVRLHVCYHNKEGLLIKHPTKTALHYLRNGFMIDMVAVFPVQLFASKVSSLVYVNRLLQMHRYISFLRHIYNSSNGILPLCYQLSYLPVLIVICNSAGFWLISNECEYNPMGVVCSDDSLLASSPLSKPISSIRAHFYGVYIATSAITGIGLQGFGVKTDPSKRIISILGVLGGLISLMLHSYLTVLFTYRRKILMDYQEAFKTLIKYLDDIKVSARLKKVLTDTVTLKWNAKKGRNVENLIKVFTRPLQVDILYGMYGPELLGNSVFTHKTVTFYKNLLPYMKSHLVLRGGYLETINDISNCIYILHKGSADVLGPDGSKFAVLYPGSMFGNLQNSNWSRLKVSIVANCDISMMEVETEHFLKILSYHPKIKAEFDSFQMKYVNYIPALDQGITQDTTALDLEVRRLKLYKKINYLFYAFVLFVPCYTGIILELYQFSVKDSKYLFVLYACDLIYAVYCAIKYRDRQDSTWVDSLGMKRRKHTHSVEKCLAILSLFPVDVFAFHLSTDLVWKYTLLRICRLNRYFRLYNLYLYFEEAEDKIDVNLYVIRLVYIVALGMLILNFNACIIGASACFFPVNTEPHVPNCDDLIKLSSSEKLELYMKFIHVASDCFSHTSQRNYYPRGLLHIIIFICVMIISHHMYIVCVSQVIEVLLEGNQTMFNFTALADRISYFTDDENVSSAQVRNIFGYIQILWAKKLGVIIPNFLTEAPPYLKDAVAVDAFAYLFVDHPIFGKCHEDCLRQIMQKLIPRTYYKNNYVVFSGDVNNSMYFILKGKVVTLKEDDRYPKFIVERTLEEKSTFGLLQGLYYKKPHASTFMCARESIILQLRLSDWEYLLDYFPASKVRIYEAAEDYFNL